MAGGYRSNILPLWWAFLIRVARRDYWRTEWAQELFAHAGHNWKFVVIAHKTLRQRGQFYVAEIGTRMLWRLKNLGKLQLSRMRSVI